MSSTTYGLTPTMERAIALADQNGGKLRRFPGGFWSDALWQGTHHGEWFGTSTVEALVRRNLGTYTEWKGATHKFPVEFSRAARSGGKEE